MNLADNKLHNLLTFTSDRPSRLKFTMIGDSTVMSFEVIRTPFAPHGYGAYAPVLDVTINGAGATFPAPLYNAWSQEYGQLRKVAINYQAIGSGAESRLLPHVPLTSALQTLR